MIRRLLALFAAPRMGAAPAPAPLPVLAPMPGASAYHQRRAHRASAAVHMTYGRWMVGHECVTPVEIAELAEVAAQEWVLFSLRLREEAASVDVPTGGEG